MPDHNNNNNNPAIAAAAEALRTADYLLLLAGAGFSADSGLDTYECMPEEYKELCNPVMLLADQRKFQHVWWQFAQTYSKTKSHEGYSILDQWCSGGKLAHLVVSNNNKTTATTSTMEENENEHDDNGNGNGNNNDDTAWWVYTSNVDGHFRRFASFQDSLCEIHGHAGDFRCASGMGYEEKTNNGTQQQKPRLGDVWEQWNQRVLAVHTDDCDQNSLQPVVVVPTTTQDNDDDTTCCVSKINVCCKHCSLPARPNVLMFHDTDSNVLQSINQQRDRYQQWEAQMEDQVVMNGKSLVIMEFGCGRNVPAVRQESEEVLGDCLERIASSTSTQKDTKNGAGTVTLVRVNPKDAGIDHENTELQSHIISIYDTSLNALRSIDQCLDALLLSASE